MRTFPSRLSSRLASFVVNSSDVMGVVLSPPVIIRIPEFCTVLSLFVLLLEAVLQVAAPYSITGRTYPVYICFRILLFAPQSVPASFFITASRLMALLSVSLMCVLHVSLLSSLMPR